MPIGLTLPNLAAWPGLDLSPGVEFWTLLPSFLIVSLVVGIKMSSDGVAIQQVSRVKPGATDFRLVQAAVNANGLGTLLSGLAGTLPTIAYTPSVLTLISLTGGRGAPRRLCHRRHLARAGGPAQGRGRPAHHSQPGHGGFSDDDYGSALR